MKLLKEMAWKLPVGLVWYIAAGFPFKHLPFWQGLIAWFIFYLALDLIRWGLKREKETTDTSAYRQHVYVFHDDEDSDIITDLWTCSVSDVGEYMIIWDNGAHHHYEVTKRIYGANAEEKVGVWNLYVSPKKKGKGLYDQFSEEYDKFINATWYNSKDKIPEEGEEVRIRIITNEREMEENAVFKTNEPTGEPAFFWKTGFIKVSSCVLWRRFAKCEQTEDKE